MREMYEEVINRNRKLGRLHISKELIADLIDGTEII